MQESVLRLGEAASVVLLGVHPRPLWPVLLCSAHTLFSVDSGFEKLLLS